MNLINFAVSSIVDAQTGLNLSATTYSREFDQITVSNKSKLAVHNTNPISKYLIGRFQVLVSAIHKYRIERQGRYDILKLNDHALRDIGLERYQVERLRRGEISTKSLTAAIANRHKDKYRADKIHHDKTYRTGIVTANDHYAVNQSIYRKPKCA